MRSKNLDPERDEKPEDHTLGIAHDVIVLDSDNPQARDGFQIVLALLVWNATIVMASTIELDDQSVRLAIEIHNIRPHRVLPAELRSG